jgi:hypothetical protein
MDQSHTGFGVRTRAHELDRRARAAVAAWAVFTCLYLYVRIPLWNPGSPTLSTLLLAAELFGIFSLALHIFSTWTLVDRRAPPPAAGASADIFVTTWNEPVEMLRNTLLAAKAVRHAGTVWLLDDGARPEMKRLAAELGVAYLARTERTHAKAGNLNNALGHSKSDHVAIFDCDHAPSPDFLERTLGYFSDPRVAFVQTPQDFYNVDSFQHRGRRASQEVWHEQTLFYRVIQPGKDRWNAAFFCGSCAVVRLSFRGARLRPLTVRFRPVPDPAAPLGQGGDAGLEEGGLPLLQRPVACPEAVLSRLDIDLFRGLAEGNRLFPPGRRHPHRMDAGHQCRPTVPHIVRLLAP